MSPNTVISWHSAIAWTWVLLCVYRAIGSPIASVDLVMNASCAFNMATPASLLLIIYPGVVSHVLMMSLMVFFHKSGLFKYILVYLESEKLRLIENILTF